MIRHVAYTAAEEYGTKGVGDWIQENVITIILLVLACAVLFAGKGGNFSKVVSILGCMLLGLFALGFAVVPGAAEGFSEWMINLVKN